MSVQGSHSGSLQDVSAGVQNLSLSKKKKRPQRAFHNIQSGLPSPALPSPGFSPTPQTGYFTPSQPPTASFQSPGLPAFGLPFKSPTQNFHAESPMPFPAPAPAFAAPGPTFGAPAASPTHPMETAVHVPNPPFDEQAELSLSSARHLHQREYTSPVHDQTLNASYYKSFLLFQNIVPPFAGTQYHSVDQGTATPKHIRATMYNVPESEALRRSTRLPMAVTIRPFAPLLPTEEPVPTVDLSTLGETSYTDPLDVGPPRCRRCRTYMNPAMTHTYHGKFTCNVCQFPNNTVPPEYISSMNPMTNQRLDRDERPELHKGVYDIIVPKFYNVGGADKPARELHHVFLVDISQYSINKQLPVLVADAIRATTFNYDDYDDNAASSKRKFAIILFDKSMHFYNLSPHLESAQISVSPDLDDPFVPFHEGLFADPEASRLVIEDALNNLELLCNSNTLYDTEPCFSVACRTAAMCLDLVGGGKITAILSTLPSWGPGGSKLKENRNIGRNPTAEVEKKLYSADNEYYKLLAKDLIDQNVGLDVFAVANTTVDVSNIGWLASVTGGCMYKWSNFFFERDGRLLTSQIVNSVKKCAGYQGQLKLRCSNGLQVSQYYGFPSGSESGIVGIASGTQDPVVPVLGEDQTFTVLLEYDGTLNTKYDCHFQAALLYTDPQGVRKVRVINLVLAVSERLEDVFNFVDQDSVVTAIVRDTLSFVGKELISELRNSINEKLVDIFTQYRVMSENDHNRNRTMTNQLILPDSLKHIPAFVLSFIKSKALRDSTSVPVDTRLCDVYEMLNMPVERLVFRLYPALVELHSLTEDECVILEDVENTSQFIKLPEYKPLTAASLENGVYILCDGTTVYVRIHPDANKFLVKDLFGEHIETVDDIDPLIDSLPELPTHISQQARNLVKYFQKDIIGSYSIGGSAIQIVRDGIDGSTQQFRECLVEDKLPSKTINTSPGLPEFLTTLHKAIKVKLESVKKVQNSSTAQHTNDTLAQRMLHF